MRRAWQFYGEEKGGYVTVKPFSVTANDFDGGRIFALERRARRLDLSGAERASDRADWLARCRRPVTDSPSWTRRGWAPFRPRGGTAIEDGGGLVVCRPTPMVQRVLEITGLDTWVTDWDPAWSSWHRGWLWAA